MTPTLHASFADPDLDNGKVQYEVGVGHNGPLVTTGDGPSPSATRDQDGSDFRAGTPITS